VIPLLVLDIDGVLNSAEYMRQLANARGHGAVLHPPDKLDPAAVARLNRLLALAGGPHVVISSAWRAVHGRDATERYLAAAGVKAHVVGVTPKLWRDVRSRGTELTLAAPRGREIQAWLDEHPGYGPVVILDDNSDMEHLLPRLVQTTWAEGLQDEHVARAVKMLKGQHAGDCGSGYSRDNGEPFACNCGAGT
jgi:hypothetical protein